MFCVHIILCILSICGRKNTIKIVYAAHSQIFICFESAFYIKYYFIVKCEIKYNIAVCFVHNLGILYCSNILGYR